MTALDPTPTRSPRTRGKAIASAQTSAPPEVQTIASPPPPAPKSLAHKAKAFIVTPGPTHVGLLLAGAAALTLAAAGPTVPNWHGVKANVAGLLASLGLGPANAKPVAIAPAAAGGAIAPLEDAPPVQLLRDMTPEEALAWNTRIPLSSLPNRAADAFRLPASNSVDRQRALDCLTATVYYEAANESPQGQRAVAQVVLNRLRHPAYPKTVCGVTFQGAELPTGCQFTYTCDGSLARVPSGEGWARARKVAEAALAGHVEKSVGGATHYHTLWVVPYWQAEVAKVATIGAHIFYRWDGGWTVPRSQVAGYASDEPDVATLYGVGAAPFYEPRVQLAVLAGPTPPPPAPEPEAVAAPVAEAPRTVEVSRSVEALPAIQFAPATLAETQALAPPAGEVRKNRAVPLPGGW
jgi:hypothetical protein